MREQATESGRAMALLLKRAAEVREMAKDETDPIQRRALEVEASELESAARAGADRRVTACAVTEGR